MKTFLIGLFSLFLMSMLFVTVRAQSQTSIFDVSTALTSDPWFHATLVDAYLGFLTFYVWVFYKQSSWLSRVVWFLLIMTLGNMAVATYVLVQLFQLPHGAPVSELLLRKS